jgi:ribonucleoside-diphosphate reductase alpha chain|nr:MAG TPA: ribonucleoside-diphosphate reductase, adenosylcobalamin-dependent [Caudoviricetes sp.]
MLVQEWLGKDNKLGQDIWKNKYQYDNETFDEWLDRISNGDKELKQLIIDKKFLFGGRILSNRGINNNSCMSNCFVIPAPKDSIESIFDTAKKSARVFSFGGGVGFDISNLRPNGMKVNNSAKTTTGAVSFMDLYSLTTEIIGQNNRKGALMLTMEIDHPDIEEFIDIKKDLDRVTKANISVKVNDKFMKAVENNKDWELKFITEHGDILKKNVNARKIFRKLCENNHEMGEPGCLFNNRIQNYNLTNGYENYNITSTNPCGEQPLSENSSCLLSSLNLSEFVLNPFTNDSKFDYESFIKAIKVVVRAMNEVLDENIYRLPLKEQQDQSKLWRQVGIGIMGLSDTFIKLGFTYGDEQSLKFSEDLGNIFINECIKQSSLLAKEQGVFPNYNYYSLLKSKLYNDIICDEVKEIVKENGLRNVSLTSIAPTGSIGTMLGTSTGIEPNFRFSYNRKTESLGNGDKYFKVDSQIVKDYKQVTNDNSDNLPNYFIESQDISYINRIKMQGTWQKYIDTGISSTINLPNDTTVEDIENIYMEAWKYGLKGITCFRDGCKRMGILTTNESKIEDELHRGEYEKKPDNLIEVTRKIYSGCGKMMLHISVIPKEKRIFDVYVTNSSAGGCALNIQNIAISISNGLRHGSTLASYKKSFEGAGKCSSYATARAKGKYVSKGNSCGTSILYTLLDVEKELQNECLSELVELGYYKTNRTIKEENKFTNEEKELIKKYGEDWFAINFRKCPICSSDLDSTGNCVSCPNCSYTKCE